jgi:hypothetical protein
MLIRRQNSIDENWEYTNTHTFKNNAFYEQKIPEGRAIYEANNWNNEFEYRDIFGNLRISFAAENGALVQKQRADYDAFGWIFNENVGNTKNYRQFQNQNRVEDFGLDIDIFKYRASDPQIGRFWSIDPLAESYVYNSPYALQENKFGRGVELEGLELITFPLTTTTVVRTMPVSMPLRMPVTHTSSPVILSSRSLNTSKAESTAESKSSAKAAPKKEEGSYTTHHESDKKYHGKGDEKRAKQSGDQKAKDNNDPVKKIDYKPEKNAREAYKAESRRMETDKQGNKPGHKSENNYNKRASPGDKYRKQDGGN